MGTSLRRGSVVVRGIWYLGIIFCLGCARNSGRLSNASSAPGGTLTDSAGLQSRPTERHEIVAINSVLVLPPRPDLDQSQNSALSAVFTDGAFYRELAEGFRAQNELQVVASDEVAALMRKDLLGRQGGPLNTAEISALGQKYRTDAVLATTVHRYSERSGSAVGANAGAEVDFAMELRTSAGANLVWSASYHFSDQAISENLLKAIETLKTRSGKGWITARQALSYGFAAASKELALVRQQAFQVPTSR